MKVISLRTVSNISYIASIILFPLAIVLSIRFHSVISMSHDRISIDIAFTLSMLSDICCIFALFIKQVTNFKLLNLFTDVNCCQLDSEALMKIYFEISKAYGWGQHASKNHMLLSLVLDLQGDYPKALYEAKQVKTAIILRQIKLNLVYFYLRCGQVENARSISQKLFINMRSKTVRDASNLHTAGLYYLESEELSKAQDYFLLASSIEASANNGQRKITRLNCEYDLARLEEKQSNLEKAAEHYRQAAGIGPKTWMGQESARRAEALASRNM